MRIAVVGAGILGASTAYHLAAAGAEVLLVESSEPGRATAAGAGIICPWVSSSNDAELYGLASASARYYPELIAQLAEAGETDVCYRKTGALSAPSDEQFDLVERRLRERAATAPEAGAISRLDPHQARALFPPLARERAALHIEGGARVDGAALAAALARAAVVHRARAFTGSAALKHDRDRVTGIVIAGQTFDADAVILTAGVWANALIAPLGLRMSVEPQRGQIIHLRLPGANTSDWPSLLPMNEYYLLACDESRVVVGATRETGAAMDCRVTASGQAEVLNAGLAVAPGLASATVLETRVGFRPVSASGRPQLGRVGGCAGLLVGNGMGRSGLTIGPLAGKLLAQLALGQKPEIDLSPYPPGI